jgi:hypothetical protein
MATPATPNFFVAGAPKAGTTSLYHYLRQHPQIYMSPIKEPCFFAPEVVDFTPDARRNFNGTREAVAAYLDGPLDSLGSGIVLDWPDYLKLFKRVKDEIAIGEVSGSYLASSGAAGAIRSRIPDARIVIMLRHPVDRLYSQYVAALSLGLTRAGFARWAEEQQALEARRHPPFGVVWTGRYAEHLQRFRTHFPADRLHVAFYDDYVTDRRAVVRGVLAFLGVDPDRPIDLGARHNVTRVPRWPRLHAAVMRPLAPMVRRLPHRIASAVGRWYRTAPARPAPHERARVAATYADDVRAVEILTGRRLDAWKA